MRHGKKFNHLGRKAAHRKSMLSNMATSLILHKRISTTLAKAKELKKYVEPLITRAKEDTTHNRRMAFSYLKNKEAIIALFGEVILLRKLLEDLEEVLASLLKLLLLHLLLKQKLKSLRLQKLLLIQLMLTQKKSKLIFNLKYRKDWTLVQSFFYTHTFLLLARNL